MARWLLRFGEVTLGRPYHAARVTVASRNDVHAFHDHADFCEFVFVSDGEGCHLVNGRQQPLSCGDVVLVLPEDSHTFVPARDAHLEFVNVAFRASDWRQFVAMIGGSTTDERPGDEPWCRPLGEQADPSVRAAFDAALRRFARGPSTLDLIRFWTDVLDAAGSADGPGSDPGWPVWLSTAITEMRREPNLREGLDRFLELAAVSQGHLSRSVRQHLDMTPSQLVIQMRLQHADHLLTATNASIGDIAARCGFSSQSYFTRCFKEQFGDSPRRYRERSWRAVLP
jgi:AraC-like DNA-binding protein/quercetin dioxygenase-like cupin family protein